MYKNPFFARGNREIGQFEVNIKACKININNFSTMEPSVFKFIFLIKVLMTGLIATFQTVKNNILLTKVPTAGGIYLSVILYLEFYWSSHVLRSSTEYPSRCSPSSTMSPHRQPRYPVTAPVQSSGLVVTLMLILGYRLTYEEICNRENSESG